MSRPIDLTRTLPVLSAVEAPETRAPARRPPALEGIVPFAETLTDRGVGPLCATGIEVLQINVGKLCNQTCRHCHVDAGPDRREVMGRETMEHCLRALERGAIGTVDITGGAPELNPSYRWLVEQCRARGAHVMTRCNLTVLETGPGRDLPEFFAANAVEVVASLPHYRALNTDRQRGAGVFEKSVRALRRLNEAGYGRGRPERRLVLVTNPAGAFLPGGQASLEREWKAELLRRHGVRFDALYTITNMPIGRYLGWLEDSGNLEAYMHGLVGAFNPAAVPGVMCRTTLSVGWDGTLYDCDFNQMLDMPVGGAAAHVADFDAGALGRRPVATDHHCYGCTAGAGSSCGGATT